MQSEPKRVLIQRNPISGSGFRQSQLRRLVQRLEEHQLEPIVYTDRAELDAERQRPQFTEQTRCIVAAGGDGTIDDLINRFPGVPLAILAMGTENLLARHYEVPHDGRQVADMILDGHVRHVDLGEAGDRRFAVMASCGFDADVVYRAHLKRTGRITKLHYVRPILGAMIHNSREIIKVKSPDLDEPKNCELVVVSNLPRYATNLPINPDARDDDGLLDICLIDDSSVSNLLRLTLWGMAFRTMNDASVFRFRSSHVELISERPLQIQADGDPVSKTPLEFRALPQGLDLVVPQYLAESRLHDQFVNAAVSEA